jgi:hypothetical protein
MQTENKPRRVSDILGIEVEADYKPVPALVVGSPTFDLRIAQLRANEQAREAARIKNTTTNE